MKHAPTRSHHRRLILAVRRALVAGFVAAGCWLFWSMTQEQRQTANMVACHQNLKRLAQALFQYTEDWDECFPPASRWSDCLNNSKYLPKKEFDTVLHCPSAHGRFGYAMNSSVGSRPPFDFVSPRNTVLLFETDSESLNASGSVANLARKRHHILNCLFCDGSVRWVNQYMTTTWIWSAPHTK